MFHLDDDYLEKNIPPEAEELSFEVSYSEVVTETPDRNKWKKSDIKKEDYVLPVSKASAVSLITSRDAFCVDLWIVFFFSVCVRELGRPGTSTVCPLGYALMCCFECVHLT